MTDLIPFEDKVKQLGIVSLQQEQVPCPVVHRFGPGIYIREVFMKAGTFVIGHYHKVEHLNILLKGSCTLHRNGNTEEVKAPMIFTSPEGRKVAFVHEDMVWLNVFSTNETDISKLEEMFLNKEKSPWYEEKRKNDFVKENREDFIDVLTLLGLTENQVTELSENTSDLIPFPFGSYSVGVYPSPIHGKGLFATADIKEGDTIAPARINKERTPAGRYTNHGVLPNAKMVVLSNGDVDLVAIQDIKGNLGGTVGEEITIDYYETFKNTRE